MSTTGKWICESSYIHMLVFLLHKEEWTPDTCNKKWIPFIWCSRTGKTNICWQKAYQWPLTGEGGKNAKRHRGSWMLLSVLYFTYPIKIKKATAIKKPWGTFEKDGHFLYVDWVVAIWMHTFVKLRQAILLKTDALFFACKFNPNKVIF